MSDPREPAPLPQPDDTGAGDGNPENELLDIDDLDPAEEAPEPETPDDEAGESVDAGQQSARQPRRERQYQNWARRAREAETRNADLERRLAALETQPRQVVDPQAVQRAQDAEYERLSMLPPDQMVRELHQLVRREVAGSHFQTQSEIDRRAFQSYLAQNPQYRRFEANVEQISQNLRAQGVNVVDRTAILDREIGRAIREGGSKALTQLTRQAASRVERQQSRPPGGRGDAGGRTANGAGRDADEELLRNTRLDENPW